MKPTRMTKEERADVSAFLGLITYTGPAPLNANGYYGITREQYWQSYPSWARGGRRAWNRLEQGGTGIMAAICWYHHIHRPGSKEWRPSIIIAAVLKASVRAAASAVDFRAGWEAGRKFNPNPMRGEQIEAAALHAREAYLRERIGASASAAPNPEPPHRQESA